MIYNIDVKSLEWCSYLQLSQDKVGIEEWLNVLKDPTKNDIHRSNQTAFNLPSRLVAKVFLFRWIYRGSAYAFSRDPDFTHVSNRVSFWEDVIERYYSKYEGLYKCHMAYIKEGTQTGKLTSPFGRVHEFQQKKMYDGSYQYSESDITNHPNQGLGADVVAMARVIAHQRMKALTKPLQSKLISTVHDSIVLDGPKHELEPVAYLFDNIFRDLPKIITQYFGVPWTVPLRAEVKYGPNMANLEELILNMS
jgi:DNA polymerase I-like protein with 3'-5' exonuclease and polymerase domains